MFAIGSTLFPVDCSVQLHQEKRPTQPPLKKQANINNSSVAISKIVCMSLLPGLLDRFEYGEITKRPEYRFQLYQESVVNEEDPTVRLDIPKEICV